VNDKKTKKIYRTYRTWKKPETHNWIITTKKSGWEMRANILAFVTVTETTEPVIPGAKNKEPTSVPGVRFENPYKQQPQPSGDASVTNGDSDMLLLRPVDSI
jgi:hypothetical protein